MSERWCTANRSIRLFPHPFTLPVHVILQSSCRTEMGSDGRAWRFCKHKWWSCAAFSNMRQRKTSKRKVKHSKLCSFSTDIFFQWIINVIWVTQLLLQVLTSQGLMLNKRLLLLSTVCVTAVVCRLARTPNTKRALSTSHDLTKLLRIYWSFKPNMD